MPNGTIDPNRDYVAELGNALQKHWPTISTAKTDAREVHAMLGNELRQFMAVWPSAISVAGCKWPCVGR
jgi:hypothetical protein